MRLKGEQTAFCSSSGKKERGGLCSQEFWSGSTVLVSRKPLEKAKKGKGKGKEEKGKKKEEKERRGRRKKMRRGISVNLVTLSL